MNLEGLQKRLYPAYLMIPIEFESFYSASFSTKMTQDAIDSYVPEYAADLYKAVKKYVLHNNATLFLQDGNLDILVNKIKSEFELLMHAQIPTREVIYQTLLFIVEGK